MLSDLVVVHLLVTLPSRLPGLKTVSQVIQIVMYWQPMVEFLKVMEEDVDCDLERYYHNVEQEVVHEILNLDTIHIRHNGFIVKDPKQASKERLREHMKRKTRFLLDRGGKEYR